MDLRELNATLLRLGRAPVTLGKPLPGSDEVVAAGPWRLVIPGDRGEWTERLLGDEGAACRWILTRELMRSPASSSGQTPYPASVPELWTGPRQAAPSIRWKRRLWPMSTICARADGVGVLVDTSSLYEHGIAGSLYLTGIEVTSGRLLWSTPIERDPVAKVAGDCVIVSTGERWSGLDLWTGGIRWTIATPSPHARVVAQGRDVAVVALGPPKAHGHTGLVGIDVRTGQLIWQHPGGYSDLSIPYYGIPLLERVLAVSFGSGHIRVDAITTADGSVRHLFETTEPADFRGAAIDLIADELTADGAGYLILRTIFGVEGRGLGDLIIQPGSPNPIVVRREPSGSSNLGEGAFAQPCGSGHFIITKEDVSSLTDLSGHTLWHQVGRAYKPYRLPGLTLAGFGTVIAIDDSGKPRWQADGALLFAHDGIAYVRYRDRYTGYDIPTGHTLWETTQTELFQYPNRDRGFHPDDRTVLIEAENELRAVG